MRRTSCTTARKNRASGTFKDGSRRVMNAIQLMNRLTGRSACRAGVVSGIEAGLYPMSPGGGRHVGVQQHRRYLVVLFARFGINGVIGRFGQQTEGVLHAMATTTMARLSTHHRLGEFVDRFHRFNNGLLYRLSILIKTFLIREVRVLLTENTPPLEFEHSHLIIPCTLSTPLNHRRARCIVHGAGGTLLQQLEEHRLHVDLRTDDVLFITCGWMMWNWLLA